MTICDYPYCDEKATYEIQLGDTEPLTPQKNGWFMIYVCNTHSRLESYTRIFDYILNKGLLDDRIII